MLRGLGFIVVGIHRNLGFSEINKGQGPECMIALVGLRSRFRSSGRLGS